MTVLVNLDRRVPVGFVDSRKHKDVKKVLKEWGVAVSASHFCDKQKCSVDI